MCGHHLRAPSWGRSPNPGLCPDWVSNWRPFTSQSGAQSTEPRQPGQISDFFTNAWRKLRFPERLHQNNRQFEIVSQKYFIAPGDIFLVHQAFYFMSASATQFLLGALERTFMVDILLEYFLFQSGMFLKGYIKEFLTVTRQNFFQESTMFCDY